MSKEFSREVMQLLPPHSVAFSLLLANGWNSHSFSPTCWMFLLEKNNTGGVLMLPDLSSAVLQEHLTPIGFTVIVSKPSCENHAAPWRFLKGFPVRGSLKSDKRPLMVFLSRCNIFGDF